MKLSIVMPVLNEASSIAAMLAPLQGYRRDGHEVILVDGQSVDDTVRLARPYVDRVVVSAKGRALQMNAGATSATGDVFLFLHADTLLPDDALNILRTALAGRTKWGRFDVRLSGENLMFRVIETMINLRSRVTGVATGDQAIFVARDLFFRVGGYPEIALMEDIALSKRLRNQQAPVCLRVRVQTSSRRWEQGGIWRTIFLMWQLRLAYFFGKDPALLARKYR